MASQRQNYNNPRPYNNQQQVYSHTQNASPYNTSNSAPQSQTYNNAMQTQQGYQNGVKTPPMHSQSRMSAPLAKMNSPLKTGPISYPQTPLNFHNPTTVNTNRNNPNMNVQNGIQPQAPQWNTSVGNNVSTAGSRPPPVQFSATANENVPRSTITPSPLSQLGKPTYPQSTRPTLPNTLPETRPNLPNSQFPASPSPTTAPVPQNGYMPASAVSQEGAPINQNTLNNSSMHNNQENTLAAGFPTGKRRPYPQQVPPSIPTSYNQDRTKSNSTPNLQSTSQPNHNSKGQTPKNTANQPSHVQNATNSMGRLTVEQSPTYPINLLEQKQLMSHQNLPLKPPISQDSRKKSVHPDVLRCTFNAIPQTSALLKQSKLPFGIYVHPFKQDVDVPVITSVITRCRSCRSYLNPFVSILDQRRWQCNMCFRINDIPEELCYDTNSRQYSDIRKRNELTSATVEFIAPSEYMLRPPQPSVYLFALDVSFNAINTGYLEHTCRVLAENIGNLPGDMRMMIGFITFNSSIHFYSLKESQSQPQMFVVTDLEDIFLPAMDGLLVNVKENREMILELLEFLPGSFSKYTDTGSATGAAMVAARKMVSSVGGRITLFQTCLPSVGPGKLTNRESSGTSTKDTQNLNPATDYYKKLSLECAGEQIAIDLFVLSGQYIDLASLSCAPRYSSGGVYYYPEFHGSKNPPMVKKFQNDFKRYLTRDIGFEAVMRLRCTKGMNIHTFHGNFFVRSTDLLSLPNVNPDHSFSMQIDIEDNLTEANMVAFQGALLYTTTKGERRIRVHTLALPVTSKLSDVYMYADQEAIISSLSKLAVDRTLMSSLGDAREALMNACIDFVKVYRSDVCDQRSGSGSLLAPYQLRLIPLYVLALMKNPAFTLGSGISLDTRLFSLLEYKWQPIVPAMLKIYPRLYSVLHLLDDEASPHPPILQATAERLSRQGMYLMDAGAVLYLFVGRNVSDDSIQKVFNVSTVTELPENLMEIPVLDTPLNVALRDFIDELRNHRPLHAMLIIIREDQKDRMIFLNKLIDDRTESTMSYHEFLQHIHRQCVG